MSNRKECDIRTGDVFASNKTGAKMYIDSVSRGYAAYRNEDGEVGRALISDILALFHKAA